MTLKLLNLQKAHHVAPRVWQSCGVAAPRSAIATEQFKVYTMELDNHKSTSDTWINLYGIWFICTWWYTIGID